MVPSMARVMALSLTLIAWAIGCGETRPPPKAANAPDRARPGRAELLACLGAPPEALYEPERLTGAPAPGLAVHVFEQETARCGLATRRYVSYVPRALTARTAAPVLLVLHGQGG